MRNLLGKILFVPTLLLLISTQAVPVVAAQENVLDPVCQSFINRNEELPTACQDNETQKKETPGSNSIYGPNGVLTKAVGIISIVIGVAAVIMVIIGGFKYIIASGDANNLKSAKNTVLYALIGMFIAGLSQVLVITVLNKL